MMKNKPSLMCIVLWQYFVQVQVVPYDIMWYIWVVCIVKISNIDEWPRLVFLELNYDLQSIETEKLFQYGVNKMPVNHGIIFS